MEKHTENRTRTEQASEDLIELIRQKNYTPGDKLPTEAELSELLQVGRNTVREALRLLVSRNIVVIRQGSGTFLSEKQGVSDDPFGFSLAGDHEKLTKDLIQVRIMLEPPIGWITKKQISGSTNRLPTAVTTASCQIWCRSSEKASLYLPEK